MIDGRKHWNVKVRSGGVGRRVLQRTAVYHSRNLAWVKECRWVFTPDPNENGYFRLSLLGFLHGLTGICIAPVERNS